MGLPLIASVKKTVEEVETCWFSGKEKVPGTVVSKVCDADHLLEY